MKIYLDNDYKCHLSNDGTMKAVQTNSFDGKCDAFIEGYRFVPEGECWTRSDGTVFTGEMVAPWRDYNELDAAQRQYEQALIAQYESALSEIEKALGV